MDNNNEIEEEEYFKMCYEAVTKHKVAEKNAFSFSIERLLAFCNAPAVSQNFAKLSMILEVAVDIYSHKVDSVHKMGNDMANTLSACTEDCKVSAARKKDHRAITSNCDEIPKNTDNIIKSRSEDLRTGGRNQQNSQGVLGTEESCTVIPSGRKYGNSSYQYPHKESVYNMVYYYMTELSGMPKMLHEFELWNSSSNYVGKLARLEKQYPGKLPTLPTLETYLVHEENTETTSSQLHDDCDNDRYERDINADPQCSISISDDIQMFADTCHTESEILSAPLSPVSESNQNNFTNAFSLNPPSCSPRSLSNRHLKERTECRRSHWRFPIFSSSSKRKRKFSDTRSESSLSNYVSEEFMRGIINSISHRMHLRGSCIVETSRNLNNSYCVDETQQLDNHTTVMNDGASNGEITFESFGSTQQSTLTRDETVEITLADTNSLGSVESDVPNSLLASTCDSLFNTLSQVDTNNVCTSGSDIPNSLPAATCDSGLGNALSEVDTNSIGTMESEVPNSLPTATCGSGIDNLKLSQVNGDIDEEFYFEFNNNFNGEQSEVDGNERGASANTYQTALDIRKLFDIPTKPREAGVDSKKIKNTMWEEIKGILYNDDEPTHETMSLTALFERVCARLLPDETADHNIQIMFFMLLQLANDQSTFCLIWDADSNDFVIKHDDE